MPKNFEYFLTHEACKEHSLAHLGFNWIRREISAHGDEFEKQIDRDIVRVQNLRAMIAGSLGSDHPSRNRAATAWGTFLKPRIEALDLWSIMVGSMASLIAAGTVLMNLAWSHKGTNQAFFTFAGAVTTCCLAAWKLEIDRRKIWYKYLASHLDAIKNLSTDEVGTTMRQQLHAMK